jgi:hypothetical protein
MKLKEIIKNKLAKTGFDKHEPLIEYLEKLVTPALEEKAGKMVTPRLIKRAVGALLEGQSEESNEQ